MIVALRGLAAPKFPSLAPAGAQDHLGAMHTTSDTLALIGNTPLVRLKGPSEATGCDIFGKCEFANPGASVKDRAALFIVEDAEARGTLKPGGTIVEGTRGKHRHRAGAGREREGLQDHHRHARHPVQGEDGDAAGAGRRTGAGPRRALFVALPFRPHVAADRGRDRQRDLGKPVRQYRQPARAYRRDRGGDLDADGWSDRPASPARSAPVGRSPASGWD